MHALMKTYHDAVNDRTYLSWREEMKDDHKHEASMKVKPGDALKNE
jgi:hypothetical protein